MVLSANASSERVGLGLSLYNSCGSFDATLFDICPCALEASKKAPLILKYLGLRLEAICPICRRETTDTGLLTDFLGYAAKVGYLHVGNRKSNHLLGFHRYHLANGSMIKAQGRKPTQSHDH